MRCLTFVLTFFLFPALHLFGQNFVVVGTDTKGFPSVQLRAYGFASDGTLQSLDSIQVAEDGVPKTAVITQEPAASGDKMSCMVMVDASASMKSGGNPTNLAIAKAAATVAPSMLNSLSDEIALGLFDARATILHGLTTDKASYAQALQDIATGSGFTLDSGLMAQPEGAFSHLRNARYNRMLLLVVDGSSSFDVKHAIQTAVGFRIPVYIIGVRTTLSKDLKHLADTTRGLYIEGVATTEDAELYSRAFVAHAKNLSATQISYTSVVTCKQQLLVNLARGSVSRDVMVTLSGLMMPYLEWNVTGLNFGFGSDSRDRVALLTARNGDIQLVSSSVNNSNFSLATIADGSTIAKDQTVQVTVTYKGGGAGAYGHIILNAPGACTAPSLAIRAGAVSTGDVLTVTAPNGGEQLRAGVPTQITWTNVLPDDAVRIDYSTDAGNTWTPITENGLNNSYTWVPGPALTNTAAVRVQRTSLPPEAVVTLAGHRDPVYSATFTYDNRYVITGGHDATVRLWDAVSGKQLYELGNHSGMFAWATATHPQMLIGASGGHDGTVKVYNLETGARINSISAPSRVWALDFAPNGTDLLIGTDRSIIVVNWQTGEIVNAMVVPSGPVYEARYSRDGSLIVSAESDRVAVRSTDTYTLVKEFAQGLGVIYAVDISPNNETVISGGADFSVHSWNALTGEKKTSTAAYTASIQCLDFSPSGMQILAGCSDGSAKIFKTADLTLQNSIASPNSIVYSARYSPNADYIVTAGTDAFARIWNLKGAVLSEDQCDASFSIVGGMPSLSPVDMGTVALGDAIERRQGIIKNTGSDSLAINGWRIVSGDVNEFEVTANSEPVLLAPGASLSVETSFSPLELGKRTAELQVDAGGSTNTTTITGNGTQQQLILPDVVNFGRKIAGQSVTDTTILLRAAAGGENVTVTRTVLKGVQQGSYQITNGGGTFTIGAGQTTPIGLQFAPSTFGRFSAWIEFTLLDGSTRVMRLYGEGTGDARIRPSTQSMLFATDKCRSTMVRDTMTIGNAGNSALVIYDINLVGLNANEFSIVEPTTFPVTVNTNQTVTVRVEFNPRVIGTKEASVTVSSNAIDATNGVTTIPLIARMDSVGFELSRQKVLFDGINEGETAEQRITIFNTGTIALRWPGGNVDAGAFRIEPPNPPVTAPGASSEVTIRFKGGVVGNQYAGSYEFLDTLCGRKQTLELEATVRSYIGCTIAIDTVSTTIGSMVAVPVRLLNKVNFDRTSITEIQAIVRVNGSILTPVGVQSTFLPNGQRTFPITIPVSQTGDVAMNLSFNTTWGNDTASFIRLDSVWTSDTLLFKTRNGQVQLSDLCREGGPRLLLRERDRTGAQLVHKPASVRIVPAPATAMSTIELHVVEEGPTRVDVVDASGKILGTIVNRTLTIGDYILPFDCTDLENGMYTLQLNTRTQRMSHQFPVVR